MDGSPATSAIADRRRCPDVSLRDVGKAAPQRVRTAPRPARQPCPNSSSVEIDGRQFPVRGVSSDGVGGDSPRQGACRSGDTPRDAGARSMSPGRHAANTAGRSMSKSRTRAELDRRKRMGKCDFCFSKCQIHARRAQPNRGGQGKAVRPDTRRP